MKLVAFFLPSLALTLLLVSLATCQNQSAVTIKDQFETYPVYEGKDLGLQYRPSASTFKVWAPAAEAMQIKL